MGATSQKSLPVTREFPATNPVRQLVNNVSLTPAFAGFSGAGLPD
jgi:hypothetical protein